MLTVMVTLTTTRMIVWGHRDHHGGVALTVSMVTLTVRVEQHTPGWATVGRDLASDELAGPSPTPYRVDGHAERVCCLTQREPSARCHPGASVVRHSDQR